MGSPTTLGFLEERTFYPAPPAAFSTGSAVDKLKNYRLVSECCMTGEDDQKKENQCLGDKGLERCIFEKVKGVWRDLLAGICLGSW